MFTDDVLIDASTMAHELGHNLSLAHTPCCDVPAPDRDYPYADEFIRDETGWLMWRPEFVEEGMGIEIMSYCAAQGDFRDFLTAINMRKQRTFTENESKRSRRKQYLPRSLLLQCRKVGTGLPKAALSLPERMT